MEKIYRRFAETDKFFLIPSFNKFKVNDIIFYFTLSKADTKKVDVFDSKMLQGIRRHPFGVFHLFSSILQYRIAKNGEQQNLLNYDDESIWRRFLMGKVKKGQTISKGNGC